MTPTPLYPHFVNPFHLDVGLEYYPTSKKALSIVRLSDRIKKETINVGFLFIGVRTITQKLKHDYIAEKLGIDIGLPHYIYATSLDGPYSQYIFHSESHFIIVEAQKIELIEGLSSIV